MDIDVITQLINTLGFPIVVTGGLAWFIVYKDKQHAQQIQAFVEALNNNTVAITQLSERIKG